MDAEQKKKNIFIIIKMTSFFLRYTPHQTDHSLLSIQSVINQLEPTKFVVAREKATHEHYHIALWGVKRSPESLRAFLKLKLIGKWYISGKEIEDKVKAIAYCIKDGDYIYNNLDVNEFLQANSISKRKVKYDDLLATAEKDYSGDDKKFVAALIDAHVRTNRKVYLPHIKAQLLLTKLKFDKYGTYKEYLVDKIMDSI